MKHLFLIAILLLSVQLSISQELSPTPDKVYLQLDRNLYSQGDSIWIKGYALERGSNKPSNKSYAIHVQMLNEGGQQVGAYKFLTIDGEAKGQIQLFSLMKPGFYELIAHTGHMKNFDSRFFFKTTIEIREKIISRKIITQFDKDAYSEGDTAKVTFSFVDHQQTPVNNTRIVYEYVINNKVIKRDGVRCDKNGTVVVNIPINGISSETPPLLRLDYATKEQANKRASQQVNIPIKNYEIDLSFFPEGGDLIEGIAQKMAFKAYTKKGEPICISGELLKNDLAILEVKTSDNGMGLFSISPEDADYSFRLTSPWSTDSLYPLPSIKKQGFSLSYVNQDEETINLAIAHNYEQVQKSKLWVSYCDSLWAVYDVTANKNTPFTISKDNLPGGIVTFTLSDEQGLPQAERLVYVEIEKPKLSIKTEKTKYDTREKVNIVFSLDEPQVSRLSYTVIDSAMGISPRSPISSIKAYAELSSELQGPIPNINQYLGNDRESIIKRDLLLMTHGWRRFAWQDNKERIANKQVKDFNQVHGQVTRIGKLKSKAEIIVLDLGNYYNFDSFDTNRKGYFSFTPEYKKTKGRSLLIAANTNKNNAFLNVSLSNTDTIRFAEVIKNSQHELRPLNVINSQQQEDKQQAEQAFMLYDTKVLEEFEVNANKQSWDKNTHLHYSEDMKFGTDLEEFDSFEELLLQVSNRILLDSDTGEIAPTNDHAIVLDNHTTTPLNITNSSAYVANLSMDLDLLSDKNNHAPGAIIYLNDKVIGYELSMLNLLQKDDIAAIAIIDGSKGNVFFGKKAYHGAIMVYTYSTDIYTKSTNASNKTVFRGFTKARKFNKPNYKNIEELIFTQNDNRITLHWEPLHRTNLDGEARASFYTGDIPGKKKIIVEGFDDDGNLYYQSTDFIVKDTNNPK